MFTLTDDDPDILIVRTQCYRIDRRSGVLRNVVFALDTIRFQDLEQLLIDEALRGDQKAKERCITTAQQLDQRLGRPAGSGCERLLDAINRHERPREMEHRAVRRRER